MFFQDVSPMFFAILAVISGNVLFNQNIAFLLEGKMNACDREKHGFLQ